MEYNKITGYLQNHYGKHPPFTTNVGKERYIDIIEIALKSYSKEYLSAWFEQVKSNGINEHGFLRVVALMGVMIARGRMLHLSDLFLPMMDFCCENMAKGKDGNDFGVKEILYTLREVKDIIPARQYDQWIEGMKRIDPFKNYACIAKDRLHSPGNWAVFNMAGEAVRSAMGLCDNTAYFNHQIPSQLTRFDQNGCYRDPHEPMLYDVITRNQFSAMLFEGYHGQYADTIEKHLSQGALFSLMTQSACFELPYGGRSNQMMFNEPALAACFEYAARQCKAKGDMELAGMFKRAAALAILSIERWLQQTPAKHVKNHFPWNSVYGIEGYGYYDKYMITMGSNAYMAYLFAEDGIEERLCPAELGGYAVASSPYFHKIFAAAGGYSLEFDTQGDWGYEATGLGRIHKCNIPSETVLSLSFSPHPGFCIVDRTMTTMEQMSENWASLSAAENPSAFAFCSAVTDSQGNTLAVCDIPGGEISCHTEFLNQTDDQVTLALTYRSDALPCPICEHYTISREGVQITISADLPQGYSLRYLVPVIITDGQAESERQITPDTIRFSYRENEVHICHNGRSHDTKKDFRNRNGIYRGCHILANDNSLQLTIQVQS